MVRELPEAGMAACADDGPIFCFSTLQPLFGEARAWNTSYRYPYVVFGTAKPIPLMKLPRPTPRNLQKTTWNTMDRFAYVESGTAEPRTLRN